MYTTRGRDPLEDNMVLRTDYPDGLGMLQVAVSDTDSGRGLLVE
jgi:hypothetical protein